MMSDPIIWRCVSYKPFSGGMTGFSNERMYEDFLSADRLSIYFKTLEERGIEKVTVKRVGSLSFVLSHPELFRQIRGTERIAHEKKNHKLEDFSKELLSQVMNGEIKSGKVCFKCGKPSLKDRCDECSSKLDIALGDEINAN